MFYVEIFLLLIFTVLCGILLALWRIREVLERQEGGGVIGSGSTAKSTAAGGRPPAG